MIAQRHSPATAGLLWNASWHLLNGLDGMQQVARTRWLCDTLRLVTASIVDDTTSIEVVSSTTSHGGIVVQITVSSGEIGKLIGRDGRMAKALREYVKAYEQKHGGNYRVVVRGR